MAKSAIEKELLEATGFKPKKEYDDRQDYLAALAKAVMNDLSDAEFDKLSNEAADWYDAAVDAINAKEEIEDFPAEEAAEEKPAKGKGKAKKVEPEPAPEDDVEAEEEADAEVEDSGEEAAEEEEPAPRRSRGKAAKEEKAPKKDAKPAKKAAKADDDDEKPAKRQVPASTGSIKLDRYGIAEGTKNAQAVAMLEKGAKMSDVNSEIGGTYYNLLKRLTKQGHKLLREPGGELKLVHKDDFGKQAKGGKGKK